MTNKQLRRHIQKIKFCRVSAIVLILIAVICFAVSAWVTSRCYNTWIDPDGSDRDLVNTLQRAIALRPAETEGYHKILDIYLEDGILTADEDAALTRVLNKHQKRLAAEPNKAASLYRRIACTYINCYESDAQERLKKACAYFRLVPDTAYETEQAAMVAESYLALERYCTEYIWIGGNLNKPSTTEVTDLIRHSRATLDILEGVGAGEQLSFACCIQSILNSQESIWKEAAGEDKLLQLKDDTAQLLSVPVTDKAAERLKNELASLIAEGGADHA